MVQPPTVIVWDENGLWKYISPAVIGQTPLKFSTPKKFVLPRNEIGLESLIQSINVEYVISDDKRAPPSPLPAYWYKRPFFQLYLIDCSDTEGYKILKPKLKAFVEEMTDKGYDYLFVYCSEATKGPSFKFPFISIYDRLKTDFKDKVVKVSYSKKEIKPLGDDFEGLMNRMRDAIYAQFEHRIAQYDNETKKYEDNRHLPGWNYCHFFAIKEGLAFTLEQFGLLREALMMYDQLAVFSEQKSYGVVFSGFFEYKDDAKQSFDIIPVLDMTNEENEETYRTKIVESRISEFDFRQYLFSRQIKLLFAMKDHYEIAQRTFDFVPSSVWRMMNLQTNAPRVFVYAWAFSTSTCVVEAIQKQVGAVLELYTNITDICFIQGDLFNYSRHQLVCLGELIGMSTSWPADSTRGAAAIAAASDDNNNDNTGRIPKNYNPNSSIKQDKFSTIKDERLKEALQSEEAFHRLFIEITAAAVKNYMNCGRHRFVHKLNGEIAAIRFRQKCYSDVETLLKSQLSVYIKDRWYELQYDVRTKLAECQKRLEHFVEYISSCLAQIQNPVCTEADLKFYLHEVLDYARTKLDAPTIRDLPSQIHIDLEEPKHGHAIEIGEEIPVTLIITNSLPEPILADKVCLLLRAHDNDDSDEEDSFDEVEPEEQEHDEGEDSGNQEDQSQSGGQTNRAHHKTNNRKRADPVIVTFENVNLQVGKTTITTKQQLDEVGQFSVDKAWIEIGPKLHLSQPITTVDAKPIIITSMESSSSIELEVAQPVVLVVGKTQYLDLEIHTNNDALEMGSLYIASDTGMIVEDIQGGELLIYRSTLDDSLSASSVGEVVDEKISTTAPDTHSILLRKEVLWCEDGVIELPRCNAHEILRFSLPVRCELVEDTINNSGSIQHEVSFQFAYAKNLREHFEYVKHVDVEFCVPFVYHSYISFIQNRVFVQIPIKCTTPPGTYVKIVDYKFDLDVYAFDNMQQQQQQPEQQQQQKEEEEEADGIDLILTKKNNEQQRRIVLHKDPNESIRNMVLHPDDGTSLLFEVEHLFPCPNEEFHCNLVLEYMCFSSESEDEEHSLLNRAADAAPDEAKKDLAVAGVPLPLPSSPSPSPSNNTPVAPTNASATTNNTKVLTHDCYVSWIGPSPIIYDVEIYFPTYKDEGFMVGKFVPLRITVKHNHSNNNIKDTSDADDQGDRNNRSSNSSSNDDEDDGDVLWYEINVNPRAWMLSGAKKRSFRIARGATKQFECVLFPIVAGYLSIPSVTLHGVADEFSVRTRFESNRVLVLPSGTSFSVCQQSNNIGGIEQLPFNNRNSGSSNRSSSGSGGVGELPLVLLSS